MGILKIAQQEEQSRREASFVEIKELANLVSELISLRNINIDDLKQEILTQLVYDKNLNANITTSWKGMNGTTYSFKTNKNAEIIDCAYNITRNYGILNLNELEIFFPMNPSTPTFLGGKDGDFKGTSKLNCVQVSLATALLKITGEKSITKVPNLNSYKVNTSPLVHTTKIPSTAKSTELYKEFKKSTYFYQNGDDLENPELLFFTQGYAYGGSRLDQRHKDKFFKAEDCTSALTKWLNAKEGFATIHMKYAYNGTCDVSVDVYCESVLGTLIPIYDNTTVLSGDVFAFQKGGHAGVVTGPLYNNSQCFNSLSYSRDLPEVEGLGYSEYCRSSYFFRPIKGEIELRADEL